MKPKLVCANCSAALSQGDKFCPSCGERIEWETPAEEEIKEEKGKHKKPAEIVCDVCGSVNEGGSYCESCGARLHGVTIPPKDEKQTAGKTKKVKKKPGKNSTVTITTLTISVGVIIIGLLAFFLVTSDRNDSPQVQDIRPDGEMQEVVLQEIHRLEHILEHDPDNAPVVLQIANLYHDIGMFSNAIEYYQEYIKMNPDDPDARVDLGICFFESGRPQRAIDEVGKVIEDFPRHQLASFNLGIIYLNLGELERANQFFGRAVEINPDNETGQRARTILEQHSF